MSESENAETEKSLNEIFRGLHEPATVTRRIIMTLKDHPQISSAELSQASGLPFYTRRYPELARLGANVINNRRKLDQARVAFINEAPNLGQTLNRAVYQALNPEKDHQITGTIDVSLGNEPFALRLMLEEEDFQAIRPKDIGGDFDKDAEVTIGGRSFVVPIITVKYSVDRTWQKRAFMHELAHCWNWLVRDSLSDENKGDLWGTNPGNVSKRKFKIACQMVNGQLPSISKEGVDIEYMEVNPYWLEIKNYLLARAKEEIIPRLFEGVGLKTEISDLQGPYDYPSWKHYYDFVGKLPFHFSDSVQRWVMAQYQSLLRGQSQAAIEAEEIYSWAGLKERVDCLPWMLMRIPLNDWEKALNQTGINNEVHWLKQIKANFDNFGQERSLRGLLLRHGLISNPLRNVVGHHLEKMKKAEKDKLLIMELSDFWRDVQRAQ